MNPLDHQLNRLLRAAASSQAAPAFGPPFGLETRVVAAWRDAGRETTWTTGILARGLILASVIMGVSLWTALDQKNDSDTDYLSLADSTASTDYP